MTDENPLQVYVRAIVNAGPREDSTRVGSGGIVRRQAVDVSPFRRVNQAVYLMAMGAREASFRTIKTAAECLADEIVNASKGSSKCVARGVSVWARVPGDTRGSDSSDLRVSSPRSRLSAPCRPAV
jgi:ribosomal protein uS7